jgi:GTP-binding protein HflX
LNQDEFKINLKDKATLVSLVCPNFEGHSTKEETDLSLRELRDLLTTLGVEAGSEHTQNKKQLEAATMLGEGKLQEIAEVAKAEGSELLVFDFELTASQLRNIKKITDLEVLDRCMVILEIFAHHARTNDAKIQIEIARLQYMLPRLTSMWSHLGRQKGGVGVGMKGEGEQQIELDRRIIRNRIEHYKKQLEDIAKSREQQRKNREKNVVTAALVGYTNAGKSSLMNRLCKVNVLEENKLFATLDSTYRTLNPDSKPPMVLIDTVGFIQNLPNTLVEGFKTTLESALEADLLILVCDLSDPNYKKHLEVTHEVLEELGVQDKEKLIIFTKKDLIEDPFLPKIARRNVRDSFLVSTRNKEDIKDLRTYIIDYFLSKQDAYDLFIPYEDGASHAKLMANTNIIKSHNHEKGIFYRIRVPAFIFKQLNFYKFVLTPDNPLHAKFSIN